MKTTYVCELCETVWDTKAEALACEKSCNEEDIVHEFAIVFDKKFFVSGLEHKDEQFLCTLYKDPLEDNIAYEDLQQVKRIFALLPLSIRKLCKIHKIEFNDNKPKNCWKILEEQK